MRLLRPYPPLSRQGTAASLLGFEQLGVLVLLIVSSIHNIVSDVNPYNASVFEPLVVQLVDIFLVALIEGNINNNPIRARLIIV